MQKPKYKAPNNDSLREFANLFVQKEITKQIGQEGIDACFIIGIQLDKVLPFYRQYAELVANTDIQLERVKDYFGPHWHKLSNGQRRTIEAAVVKEVDQTNRQIQAHIKYLEANRQQMEQLGPKGQRVLNEKIAEILGWDVEGEAEQGNDRDPL